MKIITGDTKLECLDENGNWVEVGKITDPESEKEAAICGGGVSSIDFSCTGRASVNVGSFTKRPEWQPVSGHRPEGRKSDRKRNRKNRWR